MKIIRLVALITFIFTLTGCLTRTSPEVPYYQELINSWIGHSLNEKIKQSRKPQKIYYKSNKKYAVWEIYGPYLRGGVPRTELLCTYTIEISKRGIMVGGFASGIDCPIHGPRKR